MVEDTTTHKKPSEIKLYQLQLMTILSLFSNIYRVSNLIG